MTSRPSSAANLGLARAGTRSPSASSAVLGWIAGVGPEGEPLVDFDGNEAGPLPAASIVSAGRGEYEQAARAGRPAMLVFDRGDPSRPIVVGFVSVPGRPGHDEEAAAPLAPQNVVVDGKRVCIEGADEIVLRCGEASITLRRNGRVIVRGTHVESHSCGTNRIRGAIVSIN